jgi:hypothetical protein
MDFGTLMQVAIGVLFVWIMLAAITSQIQEWISQWLRWRPQFLEETIGNILAKEELTQEFYEHPLIKSLHSKKGNRKPSKIPGRQFASVVFDMLINAGTERSVANDMQSVLERFRTNTLALSQNKESKLHNLAKALDTLLVDVSVNVEKTDVSIAEARGRIEEWFGDAMERLSGAYKRRMQACALLIGIILAAVLNADSLAIANTLWTEPLVREALAAQAEQLKLEDLGIPEEGQDAAPPQTDPQQAATQNIGKLRNLAIPLGWTPANIPSSTGDWILKIGGILLSGLAAAQGSPFWFDIMRKILNFRIGGGGGSGESPKKEEGK